MKSILFFLLSVSLLACGHTKQEIVYTKNSCAWSVDAETTAITVKKLSENCKVYSENKVTLEVEHNVPDWNPTNYDAIFGEESWKK